MQKSLLFLLCSFIPGRNLRHRVRNSFSYISGTNNKVIVVKDGVEKVYSKNPIRGLNLHIEGANNTVKIHMPTRFNNCFLDIDSHGGNVEIKENNRFRNVQIFMKAGRNQTISIGKNNSMGEGNIYCDESATCIIGNNCLFSDHINIWAIDGHSIIDRETGKVINASTTPLIIGDHCWIGQASRITKNTQLPAHTIVGGGSVVTKKFSDEYTAIAGNPARVVKTNVDWDFSNPYFYQGKNK